MNFNDLWVGDLVFVKSLNTNAKWEKMIGEEMAQVKIEDEVVKLKLSDLEEAQLAPDENQALKALNEELKTGRRTTATKFKVESKNKIDLHIEQLQPSLKNAIPQMIIQHQLTRCKVFLDTALAERISRITIIHGKGNGTLKAEVDAILRSEPEVNSITEINNGGAVEVWLSY